MLKKDIVIIVAQRLWQAGAGLVTMLLVAHFLTPIQQGWYYSFLSLATFSLLFDFGLSVILVPITAHLFVSLRWLSGSQAEGEQAPQFYQLVGRSVRFYIWLGLVFLVLMLPGGWLFFSWRVGIDSLPLGQWLPVWVSLIVVTAINMLMLPFLLVVEGSGQVGEVYAVRLVQGVLGSLGCWMALMMGAGIWAAVMVPLLGIVVVMVWLVKKRFNLVEIAQKNRGKAFNWRTEVWSLQWRVGLSCIAGYLLTQIYIPILFYVQGAVVAGQMGLSLAIANMLGLIAQSWVTRRGPAMAQAVGRRDWDMLDTLFGRAFIFSILVFSMGALFLFVLHGLLSHTPYITRALPFWSFVGLLSAVFLGNVNAILAAQLRSFRREPLAWVNVGGAILTMMGVLLVVKHYSVEGVIVVMLAVQLLFCLPISINLWRRCNHQWRIE